MMEKTKKEWKLPKNVRQIGDGSTEKKVYVEDYVMTFLEKISAEGKSGKAILLGEVHNLEGQTYIFADSALQVESFSPDSAAREELKKQAEKYFSEKQVIGWYQAARESPFVMNGKMVEIFEREFGQENQVLIVRDMEEEENLFFLLEEEHTVQLPGYYIYYEKNTAMQEYMIAGSEGESVDEEESVQDDAIKRFRKIIREKKKLPQVKVKIPTNGKLAYAAGGFLVVTVLALGVTMVYNYDKMKEVERSLAKLTSNVDSQSQYLDDGQQTAQVMLHIDEKMRVEQTEQAEEIQTAGIGQSEAIVEQQTEKTEGTQTAETVQTIPETDTDLSAKKDGDVSVSAPGRASYTVKVGDTLADISQMYYGNLDKVVEICALNGIDDENTILPGQKILLP
ncbi:MAG: LysM peptidoglycan-binding domain-containing protein [Marvinbryantia sp.]|jgi:cell division protein FtsL